ncbi:MAG: hypothetical protein MZV64_28075 [Ignavibacteriales bacterium]|nr:hypothetical protein [Ignavibacteriales bacterium]
MLQLARGAGHEGDARLHDRDLVRHLGGRAPVAAWWTGPTSTARSSFSNDVFDGAKVINGKVVIPDRPGIGAVKLGQGLRSSVTTSSSASLMRGHMASALIVTRSPAAPQDASSSRWSVPGFGAPTRRRISAADAGMAGSSRMAAIRSASATS